MLYFKCIRFSLDLNGGVVRILSSTVGLNRDNLRGGRTLQNQLDLVDTIIEGTSDGSQAVLVGSSGNADLEADCVVELKGN